MISHGPNGSLRWTDNLWSFVFLLFSLWAPRTVHLWPRSLARGFEDGRIDLGHHDGTMLLDVHHLSMSQVVGARKIWWFNKGKKLMWCPFNIHPYLARPTIVYSNMKANWDHPPSSSLRWNQIHSKPLASPKREPFWCYQNEYRNIFETQQVEFEFTPPSLSFAF